MNIFSGGCDFALFHVRTDYLGGGRSFAGKIVAYGGGKIERRDAEGGAEFDDAAGANGACDQIEDGAAFGRDCAVKVGKEAMLNGIVSKTAGEFCPEVTRDARDDFPFISGGGSVEARENRRDCGIFKREARVHLGRTEHGRAIGRTRKRATPRALHRGATGCSG